MATASLPVDCPVEGCQTKLHLTIQVSLWSSSGQPYAVFSTLNVDKKPLKDHLMVIHGTEMS